MIILEQWEPKQDLPGQIAKWTVTVIKIEWWKNHPKGTELGVQKQGQVYLGVLCRMKVSVLTGERGLFNTQLFDYFWGLHKGRLNELAPILEDVWNSASNLVLLLTFPFCDGNCLSLHSATKTIKTTQFKPEPGLRSAVGGTKAAFTRVNFMEEKKQP